MVVAIGDIEAAIWPHCDIGGHPEFGLGRRATVPTKAAIIVACATAPHDRADDAVGRDSTDAIVPVVRNVEAPIRSNRDAIRPIEFGLGSWATISAVATLLITSITAPCDRRDNTVGPDLEDALMIGIWNVEALI